VGGTPLTGGRIRVLRHRDGGAADATGAGDPDQAQPAGLDAQMVQAAIIVAAVYAARGAE